MDDALQRMARTLIHLPAPPELKLEQAPEGQVRCACGKKYMDLTEVRSYQTGVCHARDLMCNACRVQLPHHALLVCVECRMVVARMAPEKLKSGFQIQARQIYHTNACPCCQPDVTKSRIIEADLFFRK